MRDRFAFFLAIIASIALHVCLILIHTPATQAAVPVVIELVTTSSIETGDNTLSGGPPAARQDLPPQQAPEPTPPPSPPEPQPVAQDVASETVELPEQTPSQEPAPVAEDNAPESTDDEQSAAVEAPSTPTTDSRLRGGPKRRFPWRHGPSLAEAIPRTDRQPGVVDRPESLLLPKGNTSFPTTKWIGRPG